MSATFSISLKDETVVPAVSQPFDVTVENFEAAVKEFFDDADKLQAFVQQQVDAKFAAVTADRRDKDSAKATNPKVSAAEGFLVINITVSFTENGTTAEVPTEWKIDLKTKEVVESEDEKKKVVFQQNNNSKQEEEGNNAKTENAAATTDAKKEETTKEETSAAEPTANANTTTTTEQQQKAEDDETKKEIQQTEQVPTVDAAPAKEKTEKKEGEKEKGVSCASNCVIC